jgi:hypothetical protein
VFVAEAVKSSLPAAGDVANHSFATVFLTFSGILLMAV